MSDLWLQLLVTLLGSGASATLITWFSQHSLAAKSRKRDRLRDQVTLFYGPISYHVVQNDKLFELNKKFHQAYNEEFTGKKWSDDSETRRGYDEMLETTLGLANRYVAEVRKNNQKIKDVMDQEFSQCDPEDVLVFQRFYEHYIRFEVEFDQAGKLVTPDRIFPHIGHISYMEPDFMRHVLERCLAKQKEYRDLTK